MSLSDMQRLTALLTLLGTAAWAVGQLRKARASARSGDTAAPAGQLQSVPTWRRR